MQGPIGQPAPFVIAASSDFRRHARLVEDAHAVVEQGDQHAVDDETGRVVARNRNLAEPLDDSQRRRDGLV